MMTAKQKTTEKLWKCSKCGETNLSWHVVNPALGHWVNEKWCGPVVEMKEKT